METQPPVRVVDLTKLFGDVVALDRVRWTPPRGSVTGLVGRNASGKTTLLNTIAGLVVPTSGEVRTLGQVATKLDAEHLARIGFVDQSVQLLDWLRVEQHIEYAAAMQPRWDRGLERTLRAALELFPRTRVAALSGGMRQRLAVLLAVCHRPELLLLDEPVSAQDPIARNELLELLLERVVEDGATLVVSSHVLHDIEKVVDRILCLERGRVVADEELDVLKERHAEWIVTPRHTALPRTFSEPFILASDLHEGQAQLAVLTAEADLEAFRARHGVDVVERPLSLERLFPLLGKAPRVEVLR
jgi:ABC-2 type transport system ATP-binding protein